MKNYLPYTIFLLFCLQLAQGQTYRLTYDFDTYIEVFNKTESYEAMLDFDTQTNESLYTVLIKNKNTKTEIKQGNAIVLGSDFIDDELVYANFNDSIMVIQEQIDIEMMLFKEKIPKIVWNFLNDTKVENKLNLKKATTSFRGRNFTVWYTLDIPLSVGPWKLNGLPGAIATVEEDGKKYTWRLKSFKKVEGLAIKNPLSNSTYVVKSIRDYPNLKFETPERIKAKLRQIDSNFKFVKQERVDLELFFEWEK